jgi:DNA-binding transcriptional regulator YiaG
MPAKLRLAAAGAPANLSERYELEARRRFRALRMARFGSQLDAAIYLDVSTRTVERWESGAVRIPAWSIVALESAQIARAA